MANQSSSENFKNNKRAYVEDRMRVEMDFLRARRAVLKKDEAIAENVPPIPEDEGSGTDSTIMADYSLQFPDVGQGSWDLVGLALSGGGLRSASVCLGALQGLNSVGALDRVDYLSTVSGGGYVGGSFIASTHQAGRFCFDNQQGRRTGSLPLSVGDTPAVQHLRDHSNFLTPRGLTDLLQDIAIVIRGLATSAFVIAPYVILAAALTVFIYAQTTNRLGVSAVDLAPELTINWAYVGPITVILFVLWSISRNFTQKSEFAGRSATAFGWLLIGLLVAGFLQFQDWVLQEMVSIAKNGSAAKPSSRVRFLGLFNSALLTSPVIAVILSFFRNQLLEFAKSQGEKLRDMVVRQSSRLLLAVGALILPLLIWLVYLRLVFRGLADTLKIEPSPFVWQVFGHEFGLIGMLTLGALAAGAVAELIGANAYSLHGLYRDRLRQAFLNVPTGKTAQGAAVLQMHELTSTAHPYPIFNTALNVQGSKEVNRRGRNADLFSFTPHYSGSPSTGYRATNEILNGKGIDLATVMAVSGAAAAANMGVNSNRPMAFTLAALNIRLGYWAPNPTKVSKVKGLSGYYLWNEMTSALSEEQPQVLLTDGGHVENLGIYELLRRRCKLIIVVDAEADSELTFGSFFQLERFARIDLGVRITIDLEPIARTTRERMAANALHADAPVRANGPHVALGTIHYDGTSEARGQTGYLLYFKSSLTGNEPDYVKDYARRNAAFPHETTADLFYSEEQFEAYRALGFHMVRRALAGVDEVVLPGTDGTSYLGIMSKQGPKSVAGNVLRILG